MGFALRIAAAFVIGFISLQLTNVFILGNTADAWWWPSSRMGEWREAKIRTECFSATSYPQRDPLLPHRDSNTHSFSVVDFNNTLTDMAALNCYVVTHREAICDPDNRAYIVDQTKRYFDKRRAMFEAGRSEPDKVKALWDNPRTRAISAALEDHIRSGRLIRGDFGWSVPDELNGWLTKYEGTPDSCPKERRS